MRIVHNNNCSYTTDQQTNTKSTKAIQSFLLHILIYIGIGIGAPTWKTAMPLPAQESQWMKKGWSPAASDICWLASERASSHKIIFKITLRMPHNCTHRERWKIHNYNAYHCIGIQSRVTRMAAAPQHGPETIRKTLVQRTSTAYVLHMCSYNFRKQNCSSPLAHTCYRTSMCRVIIRYNNYH